MTSRDDPLSVYGPALETHAEEWEASINWAKSLGVEVFHREGAIGYTPGTVPGKPGQLFLAESASYGALIHEMSHLLEDRAKRWAGFSGSIADPDAQIESEVRAYNQEIMYAIGLNDQDSIAKLIECLFKEYRRIFLGEQP